MKMMTIKTGLNLHPEHMVKTAKVNPVSVQQEIGNHPHIYKFGLESLISQKCALPFTLQIYIPSQPLADMVDRPLLEC